MINSIATVSLGARDSDAIELWSRRANVISWSDEKTKQVSGNSVARYEPNNGRNTGFHGFGVFDKAVSSWLDNASEEHGLTEDGKTVAPLFATFCLNSTSSLATHTSHLRDDSPGMSSPFVNLANAARGKTPAGKN